MAEDRGHRALSRDGKFHIPKFVSIFKPHANPFENRKDLTNEWMGWMFHFSLISKDHFERRIREASVMTTSYLYPFCKDIHRFEMLTKWMCYLFICDDLIELGRDADTLQLIIDDGTKCIKRLEAIYVSGEDHNISLVGCLPFITCTYFIVEDILLDLNMTQRKRFLKLWESYCLANRSENEIIGKQSLDLDEISRVRLESGGMKTIFTLIEYSEEIRIPDQLWYDEKVQRLMDLCNLITIFVNDVYSFEKEYLEQNEDMGKMIVNIVGFHVLKYKCTIAEAMNRSLVIIKGYECQFEELARIIYNDHGNRVEMTKFVEGLTAVTAGNFALSIHCDRYNKIYGAERKID